MNIYQPADIHQSTVIVDANKTFLATNCTVFDTELDLNTVTGMPASGFVWIENERVEYGAIDGNVLKFCTRGTKGTSALAHSTGAVVEAEEVIPTVEKFSHYGDGLRLAYNDSGVSLASAGTTPEHAFIRNAGAGTI